MGVVGSQLRNERESRGINRVQVARATSIYAHHLAALEHGNFEELPDDATVDGYVQAYADYLGLDAAEMLAAFRCEREAQRPRTAGEASAGTPVSADDERPAPEAAATIVAPTVAEVPGESPSPVSADRADRAGGGRALRWGLFAVAVVALVGLARVFLFTDGKTEAPVPTPIPKPIAERAAVAAVAAAASGPGEETEAPARLVSDKTEARSEPEPPPPAAVEEVEPAPPSETHEETAAPAPVPSRPTAPASPLRVAAHGVGTRVVDHRLEGESDTFAAGTRVWFWTRVRGGRRGDTVHHVWLHEGHVTDRIRLDIGSADWRTHSRKTLYPARVGRWAVEARDDAGTVLARSEFLCTLPTR